MFNITLETTFEHVLKWCSEIWPANSILSLYDDCFNNLDCCKSTLLSDFLTYYAPSDHSLSGGEIMFYYIEKTRNQSVLLECQSKLIESNGNAADDIGEKSNNIANQELEFCIKMMKSNQLLKGIQSYKPEKYDERKEFKRMINMIDNSFVFLFIALAFIITSIISFNVTRDIGSYSKANRDNLSVFETASLNGYRINDYLQLYADIVDHLASYRESSTSYYYSIGKPRIRFVSSPILSLSLDAD